MYKEIKRKITDFFVFKILGDKEECDLVVMATSYHYKIPLLDDSILQQSDDKKLKLYKQEFPNQLSHHSLAVIGALSLDAAILPMFEMQTRWYALLMSGKCQLPPQEEMLKHITDDKR
jgi:dimethylaniline monooxygenase (N-oxide forming)